MNCNEFEQRMNQRLDNRTSLEGDDELCRHASDCEHCRAQLDAWKLVSSIMPANETTPPVEVSRSDYSRGLLAVVGLAAAILWMVSTAPYQADPIKPSVKKIAVIDNIARMKSEPAALAQTPSQLAQNPGQIDPALWWRSVQNQDWVGQTMPTVRSVQEGVAPIGRSLMRAVTILTIGGREQTS